MLKKQFILLLIIIFLFTISTVSAEELYNGSMTEITIESTNNKTISDIYLDQYSSINDSNLKQNDDFLSSNIENENDILLMEKYNMENIIPSFFGGKTWSYNEISNGFTLFDGATDYRTYTLNGNRYYPDSNHLYINDLPNVFKVGSKTYWLTSSFSNDRDWWYTLSNQPTSTNTVISVIDYNFENFAYSWAQSSGLVGSYIKVPVCVYKSNGEYATGSVIIEDSNGQCVGNALLDHGNAIVDVYLQNSGKQLYTVKFNSDNPDYVSSSSKTFSITASNYDDDDKLMLVTNDIVGSYDKITVMSGDVLDLYVYVGQFNTLDGYVTGHIVGTDYKLEPVKIEHKKYGLNNNFFQNYAKIKLEVPKGIGNYVFMLRYFSDTTPMVNAKLLFKQKMIINIVMRVTFFYLP